MSVVDGHYRHGLRRMLGRRTDEPHRVATPLELLFDLAFVASFGVAAEQLAHGIAIGEWPTATISFIFAMFSIVWAWINVAWFASAFDTDDWLYRLLTLVQMSGVILLAIGLPPLYASIEHNEALDNRLMVAGYVIIRVALIVQWIRAVHAEPRYRRTAIVYALFVGAAQVGWVVLAILHVRPTAGLLVAVALLGVEVLGPVFAERRGRSFDGSTPWHPHHLAERFALLTIIALGETVFGTVVSATEISTEQGWTMDAVAVIPAGVTLAFALWWTYFLLPSAPALERHRDRVLPWGYGHVFLYAAIAAVGAALHLVAFEAPVTTAVIAIAVPVILFTIVRYLLQTLLVAARPRGSAVHVASVLLPGVAIVLAVLGAPLWLCLIVVLASPVTMVVAYELGGWRALEGQLARDLRTS